MSTEPVATGLSHDDLAALPDDGQRHELIHREHFVTPAPIRRHQRVVLELAAAALVWSRRSGGEAYVSPVDVVFGEGTVLEPDVVVLGAERAGELSDPRFVDLDARRVERYVLGEDGRYGAPTIVEEPATVASVVLDGLRVDLAEPFDDRAATIGFVGRVCGYPSVKPPTVRASPPPYCDCRPASKRTSRIHVRTRHPRRVLRPVRPLGSPAGRP